MEPLCTGANSTFEASALSTSTDDSPTNHVKEVTTNDGEPPEKATKAKTELSAGAKFGLMLRVFGSLNRLKLDGEPVAILPELYLGSVGAALNTARLKELNISAILCVAAGLKVANASEYKAALVLPVIDIPTYNIAQYFPTCNEFIDLNWCGSTPPKTFSEILAKSGTPLSSPSSSSFFTIEPTESTTESTIASNSSSTSSGNSSGGLLIHCYAGRSRSATILLAYLMYHCHWTLESCLYYVNRKREVVPNVGFITALLAYERQLKDSGIELVSAPKESR